MLKKIAVYFCCLFLLLNISGCFLLLAGAAGGAGTSVWLSGKLTQEFHASLEKTIKASKDALKSLRLDLVKESVEGEIAQLKSKYTDGKEIWIDVRKITESSTKVEVRVGAINPDKAAADKILKRIQRYL